MKKFQITYITLTIVLILLGCIASGAVTTATGFAAKSVDSPLTQANLSRIENLVESQMKKGNIPGAAVVIVNGKDTVYQQGFGYADLKQGQPVTNETVFELGSLSKAFTGLGIMQLVEEGRIRLDDPLTKYVPWLHMTYAGQHQGQRMNGNAEVTLRHLLYHTSGIPFHTISNIPEASGDKALEQTVRTLKGQQLDFYPGERFQYATINYDVLGYVIQKVTGLSYEYYIQENLLKPLGLGHTYVSADSERWLERAQGYKIGYLTARNYDAPEYRGNTPAGYIYTDSHDLATWLKVQLGTLPVAGKLGKAISDSHMPDRSVSPGGNGASYAAGWFVYQNGGGELSHNGSNPTFSSYMVFRPEEKLGVAIMANINSVNTEIIGQGIMDILLQKKPVTETSDLYRSVDRISCALLAVTIPFILLTVWFLLAGIAEIAQGRRKLQLKWGMCAVRLLGAIPFACLISVLVYQIPQTLFDGVNWKFVQVWAPSSFTTAILCLYCAILLFIACLLLNSLFPRKGKQPLFLFIVLCLISGLGNTLIIFIINEALTRTGSFQTRLFSFFVLGILVYAFSQRIVRVQLIKLTNNLVYEKQIEIIDLILESSYDNMENVKKERVYTALNNDTATISAVVNVLVFGFTSLVTLVCCFIYLGFINIYGLLLSFAVIAAAAACYFFAGRSANKLWEDTRDIQNDFFKFIGHLANGFKELSLHYGKKQAFRQDITKNSEAYRDKRIKGEQSFANVFVIGELLFTVVIGAVVFIFPVVFENVQSNTLRSYVFIFLYMAAPVRGVLDVFPDFIRVRISWKRINQLFEDLKQRNDRQLTAEASNEPLTTAPLMIELQKVEFSYVNTSGEQFTVGPINLALRAGEITFITGGNGSGKSTLVKLITGLYQPCRGTIRLNGELVSSAALAEKFSAVFSDYHLFDKLYGIDKEMDEALFNTYLEKLQIHDKIQIREGKFSSSNLSSGQRRRLALFIAYLEDRPVYLFDEWAADQDPEFRHFFYHSVLPELKRRGKCVVAVTHDDRYFHLADTVVQMESGQIVKVNGNPTASHSKYTDIEVAQ